MQQEVRRQAPLSQGSADRDDEWLHGHKSGNDGDSGMGTSAYANAGDGPAASGFKNNGAMQADPMGNALEDASNVDLLRYIGDLVEELQALTERTGSRTLAGLLALAHQEALVQQHIQGMRRR
jgi:hypothetical protein